MDKWRANYTGAEEQRMELDHKEFEYPIDFQDEEVQETTTPELPLFKASAILYISAALFLFAGVMIPMVEMMSRPGIRPDTFVEMFEWNPFSQIGLITLAQGLFFFWLGLMTDRRGA